MKNYVSVCDYDHTKYPKTDYTSVESVLEPCDCPTMREIVSRHICGLDTGVTSYDGYDDEYQHIIEPGMDYFDVADMHRREVGRLKDLESQAMAEKNLTNAKPFASHDESDEESDTSEQIK